MYKYFTEKLIMNAQEYRDLVNKLSLLEDDADDGHLAAAAQPGVTAVPSTIEDQISHAPTFNQAYAMAKKAGLKKFKWCQCKEYVVKDAPVQGPKPTPTSTGAKPTPTSTVTPTHTVTPTNTGAYPASGGMGGGALNNPPQGDMVPGTYQPDINSGGYNATYMPKKTQYK